MEILVKFMRFVVKNKTTTRDDLMIVLGDAGINYYANEQDIYLKIVFTISNDFLLYSW